MNFNDFFIGSEFEGESREITRTVQQAIDIYRTRALPVMLPIVISMGAMTKD